MRHAADSYATCIAEVFQEERFIDPKDDQWLVCFHFEQDLPLLDLTGLWPTRAGASMAINSADRSIARAWSRAIYGAFQSIVGLRYASAMHANSTSYAFYERARPLLARVPVFHEMLNSPALDRGLRQVAELIGYDIS